MSGRSLKSESAGTSTVTDTVSIARVGFPSQSHGVFRRPAFVYGHRTSTQSDGRASVSEIVNGDIGYNGPTSSARYLPWS